MMARLRRSATPTPHTRAKPSCRASTQLARTEDHPEPEAAAAAEGLQAAADSGLAATDRAAAVTTSRGSSGAFRDVRARAAARPGQAAGQEAAVLQEAMVIWCPATTAAAARYAPTANTATTAPPRTTVRMPPLMTRSRLRRVSAPARVALTRPTRRTTMEGTTARRRMDAPRTQQTPHQDLRPTAHAEEDSRRHSSARAQLTTSQVGSAWRTTGRPGRLEDGPAWDPGGPAWDRLWAAAHRVHKSHRN